MKKIQSLSHYIDEIGKIENKWKRKSPGNVIYRGQPDSNWNLRPGIYRDYEARIQVDGCPEWMRKRHITSMESSSLSSFIQKGVFFERNKSNYSRIEWYFLSQHYGLKTRLLDWTDSYLIALFFALEGSTELSSPVVYLLDHEWLNFKFHFISGTKGGEPFTFYRDIPEGLFGSIDADFEKIHLEIMSYLNYASRNYHPFPIAFRPMYFDDRMYNQKSYFTLHGHEVDFFKLVLNDPRNARISNKAIKEYLIPLLRFNLFGYESISKEYERDLKESISVNVKNVETRFGSMQRLDKLVIDPKQIKNIRKELRKAGIDNSNIYPGYSGLARDMNELFYLNGKI